MTWRRLFATCRPLILMRKVATLTSLTTLVLFLFVFAVLRSSQCFNCAIVIPQGLVFPAIAKFAFRLRLQSGSGDQPASSYYGFRGLSQDQSSRGEKLDIVTHLVIRGSNPGGRRDFPHPPRPGLRPTQPPIQSVPGLSWE